jgi:hypothetical protein
VTTVPFAETVQLADPVEHRGVVVAPLFPRRSPASPYVTLEEAVALGFHVTEVDEAGSVPELLATNPLDTPVLLYDGEELLGAKQNRILDLTVLAGERSELRIPVSCVEAGRWSERSTAFTPSDRHSYPELRRIKAELMSAVPLARGAAQSAVWEELAAKSARHRVQSPTGAQRDIFAARERELAELRDAFPLVPGQSGALLALGDRLCLDYVSRPDAFALLYPRLLDGYLLDAVEHLDGPPAEPGAPERFLAAAAAGARSRRPSVGLGDDVRLRGEGVVGSGLELDDELLQLCAFSSDAPRPRTRIAPPSRRR